MFKYLSLLLLFCALPILGANNDRWDYDFYLQNLPKSETDSGKFSTNADAMFKSLVTEYGIMTAPTFNEPAETLGSKGFETGIVYSFYSVGKDSDAWAGTFGNTAQSSAHLINIKVRKGLPASMETGANFTYLFGSHMFVMGGQFKVAILEGINILPDIAVRASFNKLFGSSQVNLNSITLDAMISYDFSISGMMAIAPYFGYSFTRITASSEVILNKGFTDNEGDPFGTDPTDYSDTASYDARTDSFGEVEVDVHRFAIGARIHNAALIFTPEIIFSSESVWGINIKLGIDF